jgi:hypothetical protein
MGSVSITEHSLDLGRAVLVEQPFRYAIVPNCVPTQMASQLLSWLETTPRWKLVETDFYAQYEFSLLGCLEAEASAATNPELVATLRADMETMFGCHLTEKVDVVAHRLVTGQRIGIHNDYLVGEETHRLVVQLNRGLTDQEGGFLMLFRSASSKDVHKIVRPEHASGLLFEISANSFHAVSQMHGNERHSLVYSFYATPR